MLALYRAGRQADALAAYRHARQLLHDDLGTEPSAELQQLHHAILNRDPALEPGRSPGPPTTSSAPRPRELPPDVASFTGRAEALKALDEFQPAGGDLTGPVVISAIAGTAGVGKTALAVHWAHRVADRFPDGQLYLNLRGYATSAPLRPIEALSMMLRSLGMTPDQIPIEEAEATARYRSLLADRRVLVVLDNARSVDQVRPLLPGSPGCLALVTSRDRLAGLLARDGARRITLDVLPADEEHALLSRLLGNERVAAEPEATTRLASACAYLPLAIRIAAAAFADRPSQRIQNVVSDLSSGHRLAALEVEGDREAAVRATLDLSYRTIQAVAQRVFRLLGLVPGPDFTPNAVAALADQPADEAKRALDQLANAHLLDEHRPGRYTFHDLLREYAKHLLKHDQAEGNHDAAVERLLNWYLHAADAAGRRLHPTSIRIPGTQPRMPGPEPPFGADRTDALAWLDAELPNLVATVQYAALLGPLHVAWQLSDALRFPLWIGGHSTEGLAIGHAGLDAAVHGGNLAAQAAAQLTLGLMHHSRGDYRQANDCSQLATSLAEDTGWREGEAAAHNNTANSYRLLGHLGKAAHHYRLALAIHQELGLRASEATNLANIAAVHWELGDIAPSIDDHIKALRISRDTENFHLEAIVLTGLGAAHELLGKLAEALDYSAHALAAARKIGDPAIEAIVLCNTAKVHCGTGRYDDAVELANAGLKVARRERSRERESYALSVIARVSSQRGDNERALAGYREAIKLAPEDSPYNRTQVLIGLAESQQALGQLDAASVSAREALVLSREHGYRLWEGLALTASSEILLRQGSYEHARQHAEQALMIHRGTEHRLGAAQTLAVLGRLERANGELPPAQRYWEAARELFEEIGAPTPEDVVEGLRRT
jgi:tetratricopeptide (TPR) repeat protein